MKKGRSVLRLFLLNDYLRAEFKSHFGTVRSTAESAKMPGWFAVTVKDPNNLELHAVLRVHN